MKTEITNAAEISVLPLIDNTYKTGGGPFSVGATVIRASKGPVGKVVQITDATRERIFGIPFPNDVGAHMEGLRHLADATKECSIVYAARVVAADAKYPHMAVLDITDKGAWDDTLGEVYDVNDVIEMPDESKLLCVDEFENEELMPNVEDRDLSGSSEWTNEDVATYDAADDLSLTADGAGQYCALPILSAPMTVGRKYRLSFTVASLVETWLIKSFDGVQTFGTVEDDGAQEIEFVAAAAGGIQIVAGAATSSGNFDNFSLIEVPSAVSPSWDAFTTSIETGSAVYSTELSIGDGYVLQIYPVDGDPCENRSFEIVPILDLKGAWVTATEYGKNDVVTIADGTSLVCRMPHTSSGSMPTVETASPYWEVQSAKHERFTIKFYDKNDLGIEYLLESYEVGIRPTDKDAMGRPAYLPALLEQRSTRFRANYNSDLAWDSIQDGLLAAGKIAFAGGTNGGEPTDADWIAAWDMFRDEDLYYYLMFAAGCTSGAVLANCIDIAEIKHVSFFFDASPLLNPENAIQWIYEIGLSSRQASAYYCPFAANDKWYGGKTVWGVSGAVAAACAKGNKQFSGSTPGVHYSPAGEKRAKLNRTGIVRLYSDFSINRDDFYDARLNPVIPGRSGGAVIDDSLTIHYEENYSRFVWVNRIGDYIIYRFYELASQVKHEPDGITRPRLDLGMREIMDALVTSGALAIPRDPDADGDDPYIITVEQEEIDLWIVYWEFCPTGSARRIAGQPILIK
jgi:hypothetical protein